MNAEFARKSEFTWEAFDPEVMKVPARVFASDSIMEKVRGDGSLNQLLNVASLPGIVGIAMAMPDIHQGYGFPIGGVAAFDQENGIISPGGVGYDINCGVTLLKSNLFFKDIGSQVKDLVGKLFAEIPTGANKGGMRNLSSKDLDDIISTGLRWLLERGYCTEQDLESTEDMGSLPVDIPSAVSGQARTRGQPQLMSLGSGNHFLEIQRVDRIIDEDACRKMGIQKDQIVVMTHTGSRGLGHQVATDYLRTLSSNPEGVVKHPRDPQLVSAQIKSKTAERYLSAMNAAANFAFANRGFLAWKTRKVFSEVLRMQPEDLGMSMIYGISHNMAKLEEQVISGKRSKVVIHRKGATRAFPPGSKMLNRQFSELGQPVLVPGDMGTASYLLLALNGNETISMSSSCHGAGRNMSRHKAKATFRFGEVLRELSNRGITAKSSSQSGIVEEAPGSYKDIDEVVRVVHGAGISKMVCRMVPIGVIKG